MRSLLVLAGVTLLASGCGGREEETAATDYPTTAPPPATQQAPIGPEDFAQSVAVELEATEGNDVSGTLTLTSEGEGVQITGTIAGLAPDSTHGIHIHEQGDCSAPDASSAGGHFSPLGHPHGAPGETSHVGDMGNISADAQGVAAVDVRAPQATLGGGAQTDITGKAIIVHANEDDLTSQPSGDAGARIACAVIG